MGPLTNGILGVAVPLTLAVLVINRVTLNLVTVTGSKFMGASMEKCLFMPLGTTKSPQFLPLVAACVVFPPVLAMVMTIPCVTLPLCRLLYRPPSRWKVKVALAAALSPETPTILNPPLVRQVYTLVRQLLSTPPFVHRTMGPPPLPSNYRKSPSRVLTMACVFRQSLLTLVIIIIL